MPTSNTSEVTRERAALIYCLMQRREVDLGKIIHSMIVKRLKDKTGRGLCFPSLIFELCKKAKVKFAGTDLWIEPAGDVNHATCLNIERRRDRQGEHIGRRPAPAPPVDPPLLQRQDDPVPPPQHFQAQIDTLLAQQAALQEEWSHFRIEQTEHNRRSIEHQDNCFRRLADKLQFDHSDMPLFGQTSREQDAGDTDDEEEDDMDEDEDDDDSPSGTF